MRPPIQIDDTYIFGASRNVSCLVAHLSEIHCSYPLPRLVLYNSANVPISRTPLQLFAYIDASSIE